MTDTIQIEITGSPEVHYDAHWQVTRDGGIEEYRQQEAAVPASLSFQGEAVSGRVTIVSGEGRLEVTVSKGGNRSRSATQGMGATLQLTVQ